MSYIVKKTEKTKNEFAWIFEDYDLLSYIEVILNGGAV